MGFYTKGLTCLWEVFENAGYSKATLCADILEGPYTGLTLTNSIVGATSAAVFSLPDMGTGAFGPFAIGLSGVSTFPYLQIVEPD
jgi:hypothetical protein